MTAGPTQTDLMGGGNMAEIVAIETGALLPQLVERVANGQTITLTEGGVAVARLIPVVPQDKPDVEAAVRELLAFRKAHPIDAESFRELIEEGRTH
jgi:antitoxin (DNA-binding transcriptional repressor) of toxin-antitoxin stability system